MTTTTRSPLRALGYGAGVGAVASVPMAMYALIASWEKGTGFFTPLHHIASLWAPGDAMMASMEKAMSGSDFHLVFGTAILGALIHLMTGAMYGAVFGLVVSRLHVGLAVLAGAGLVYGAIVFVLSAFIGLPIAAAVFDSGDPITNMAEMAGWGTFLFEHLIFGLTLGLLLGVARARVHAEADTVVHAR